MSEMLELPFPAAPPPAFDATAPLPAGTMLLEASAGTGKTYTITSLVLRLIAEDDIDLERILIVTFTRAAAAELRGRVRTRLTAAVTALDRARDEQWSPSQAADELDDQVVVHLISDALASGPDELARRARRLRAATEGFDDATIDTIHGFCQRTLQRAAPDVDLELGAELTEDIGDLLDEVVQDFMVRELRTASPDWFRFVTSKGINAARLRTIAQRLESEPDLVVLPDPADAALGDPQQLWDDALKRLIAAWTAEREPLQTWMDEQHAAKGFGNKKKYIGKRRADEVAHIDRWVDEDAPPIGELGEFATKRIDWLRRSTAEQQLEDPSAFPSHLDVCDAAEDLLRLPKRLVTAVLLRFAAYLRLELPTRKAERGLLSFTDLLAALDEALGADATQDAVREGIRTRFDVALIDEFQDTDPVQWRIFDRVFGRDARMQLIGDPKQAIYGFRGGNVHTYLAAKATVPDASRFTLPTNFRSDGRYLAALEQLFGRHAAFEPDGVFAVESIEHVPVGAAPDHVDDRLRFPDGPRASLELRFVPRALEAQEDDKATKPIPVGWARPFLARVVAEEIVRELTSGATIDTKDGVRPVVPRDLAVLVRTNDQARRVQAALLDVGVPAVIAADDSVLHTPEALALQQLFEALLQPSSDRLVRAVLAGPIIGRRAEELAELDGDDGSVEQLESWAATWRRSGTAAVLREVFAQARTAPRLLGQPRGERSLTNLTHLAELLHGAESAGRLGPEGVVAWLREQRHTDGPGDDQRQLRLESDDDAVTVVTVHRSKGLQYGIVWCPYLWDGGLLSLPDTQALRFLDPKTGLLSLDVEVDISAPSKKRHLTFAEHERWREQLRLMYVAMTRAQHRCIVHTGAFTNAGTSPLQRLLHGASFDDNDGDVPIAPPKNVDATDEVLLAELEALASADIGVSEVEQLQPGTAWTPVDTDSVPLQVRSLGRALDRSWQRTSFSRLVSGEVVEGSPGAEGVDHDQDVEPDSAGDDAVEPVSAPTEQTVPSGDPDEVTLARFPRGPDPGTFLHEVFEHLDFDAGPDQIRAVVDERAPRADLGTLDRDVHAALLRGIEEVLTTPLGLTSELPGTADEVTLASIGRADRLDELEFDLPLAGGYEATGDAVTLHRLAEVFDAHAAGASAPLAEFAARLRSRQSLPARGFLTGSIDLVARIDGTGVGGSAGRYLVVDYKSNWLAGATAADRSVAQDYHPARLAEEMVGHDYVLQYHLYLVALHRFLRWRLGEHYDYDRNIAGVRYLFLRGMTGPSTPRAEDGTPYGVYADLPSRALVEDLDALLRGERP